jgi:membrane carboxypeptidase/penicillin-binding protein
MSIFNLRQSYKESKVKFLWRIFFLGFATLFLYFFLIRIGLFGKLPDIEEIENPQNKLATEIYSADSVLLGKYYFDNRTPVEYKDLSPALVKTLIASEDKRFYEHSGIDILAIVRAVFYMGKRGGGSTLTQQTAKKSVFSRCRKKYYCATNSKIKRIRDFCNNGTEIHQRGDYHPLPQYIRFFV